jgi:hypothetical protein
MLPRIALLFTFAGYTAVFAGCAKAHEAPIGYSDTLPHSPTTKEAGAAEPAATAQALVARPSSRIPPVAPNCDNLPAVSITYSPEVPVVGKPLRIVATSAEPFDAVLSLGSEQATRRRGGPPYFWLLEIESLKPGEAAATFEAKTCTASAPTVRVVPRTAAPGLFIPKTVLWTSRTAWSRAHEDLYAAWIETLFDTAEGESLSVPALHELVRDRKRNFLFDHLNAREDSDKAPALKPDCADLPYVLRAYFAFKMHLPFGMAECSRGGYGQPPSCKGLVTNVDAPVKEYATPVKSFGAFVATTLADRVHSGSARTPFEDEESDYYPVPLTWNALRPGTVYADPYGHVLMVTKRVPAHDGKSGLLFAVDGQPDGTVAKKRFWRGTFLYAHAPELGGPGFKRFRPLVMSGGSYRRLKNAEISASPEYGDLSLEPGTLEKDAFYDAIDDALSSEPVDAARALVEVVDALEEQVKTRVTSVENGRKFLDSHQGPALMPEGAHVFEAEGAWEDFSTPSRDLRLLIALDVVKDFPNRVVRRIDRYRVPQGVKPEALKQDLEARLQKELASRKFDYTRSDGTSFSLTLQDVMARAVDFEMTYNPNDCVEVRWGAPEGSPERTTCKARAPAEQQAQMSTMRTFFHERKRPAKK